MVNTQSSSTDWSRERLANWGFYIAAQLITADTAQSLMLHFTLTCKDVNKSQPEQSNQPFSVRDSVTWTPHFCCLLWDHRDQRWSIWLFLELLNLMCLQGCQYHTHRFGCHFLFTSLVLEASHCYLCDITSIWPPTSCLYISCPIPFKSFCVYNQLIWCVWLIAGSEIHHLAVFGCSHAA